MKKIVLILFAALFLLGCESQSQPDNITIRKGLSGYMFISKDQVIIDELSSYFEKLSYGETTDTLDSSSALHVTFMNNKKVLKEYSVDIDGILKIGDSETLYTIISDDFDYTYISDIYQSNNRLNTDVSE